MVAPGQRGPPRRRIRGWRVKIRKQSQRAAAEVVYTPLVSSPEVRSTVVTKSPAISRIAIALFGASLVLRLMAWWLVTPPPLDSNATTVYLGGAQLLAEGGGFRDTSYPLFAPPLYAVCIAASWEIFGRTQTPIILSQILIDSATTVIVYLISLTTFGAMAGVICGILLVIYPFSIYLTLSIGSETYFTFFFALFVFLMLRALQQSDWRYFGVAGLVLGVATMIRGTTQFLPFLLILAFPIFMQVQRRLIYGFLVFVLIFSLALLPWTIRNKIVLNSFIPVASGGIVFLWGASTNFLEIHQRAKEFPAFLESLSREGITQPPPDSGPVQKERFIFRAGIESYKRQFETEPAEAIRFLFVKLIRLAYSTESGNNHGLILAVNAGIYVFAIVGVLLAWQRSIHLHWVFLLIFAYFIVLHWVTLPLFRYMMPIMPYVIAYASYAAAELYERRGIGSSQHLGAMKGK